MRNITVRLTISLAVLSAACNGHQSTSPTGPSPAVFSSAPSSPVPPSAGVSTGASISGTVVTVSGASRWSPRDAGMTVSVTGSPLTSPVDGSGHFTLEGVPAGHVDLHFSASTVDAHLVLDDVAEHETIEITVNVTGSSAVLTSNNRHKPDNHVEVEGQVAGVSGSSLLVAGKTILVTTSTQIVHGHDTLTLSNIHVGDRVHVQGVATTSTTGTTITATKIEVQSGAETPGKGTDHVELEGAIVAGSLSGSCAANTLAFTIGTTKVTTNASTQFKDVTCSALTSGSVVEVKGTMQSNGSVLASIIEGQDRGDHGGGVELSGTIAGKTGTCPFLTFTISSKTVTTNASTEFKGATCSALANGDRVEVKGTKQSNGILATRVEAKK